MGIQNFLLTQAMKWKMKDVPEAEQQRIIAMVEKNPDFFTKIAGEIQEKIKGGKDQMTATMEVMRMHESELRKMM